LAERLLEVPQELVRTALDLELADGAVIADMIGDKPCVFLAGLYRAERGIAERLLQLGNGMLPWPWIDPEKAIPWIEQRTRLVFAESQRSAVELTLASKVLVITGGPGVGNNPRQRHPAHPLGKGRKALAVRSHRPCGQAHERGHRLRGQDHPPAARSRSPDWRLSA